MRKTTLVTCKHGIDATFNEENDFLCRLWLKKHRHRKMRSGMARNARRRNRS